jgi:hypothetical protein
MSILVNSVYVSQEFFIFNKSKQFKFPQPRKQVKIIIRVAEFNLTDVANQIEKWVIMT